MTTPYPLLAQPLGELLLHGTSMDIRLGQQASPSAALDYLASLATSLDDSLSAERNEDVRYGLRFYQDQTLLGAVTISRKADETYLVAFRGEPLSCGHLACVQNFIDTGSKECIR